MWPYYVGWSIGILNLVVTLYLDWKRHIKNKDKKIKQLEDDVDNWRTTAAMLTRALQKDLDK